MLFTILSPFFVKALQLMLCLSILVFIHEMGHLLFAKLFKVRVEKFYLFFNPNFSLFRMKKIAGKWQFAFFQKNVTEADSWSKYPENTEWGIGWLPFGGYCSIAGMVDETKDEQQLAATPQPWEFRSQSAFKRLCIISGGVFFNFIFALFLYGMIVYHWGEQRLPLKNATQGLYFSEVFVQEGFRQQDKILSIDGLEPETLSDIIQWLVMDGKRNVVVLREQDTVNLTMSPDLGTRMLASQRAFDKQERNHKHNDPNYTTLPYVFIGEFFPFVIDSVVPDNTAFNAGLERGDSLVAINDLPTTSFYSVLYELRNHPCDSIQIAFFRNGELMNTRAFISDRCRLDVVAKSKLAFFEIEERTFGFFQSMQRGVLHGIDVLVSYIKQFKLIFTKEGALSLGGFGAIGNLFPSSWSSLEFWELTAFISIVLAFMNFLPLPVLDGGYILFILIEIIFRYKIKDKYLSIANTIGMWLLLLLLIYANGNDIFKLFF